MVGEHLDTSRFLTRLVPKITQLTGDIGLRREEIGRL